METLKKDEIVEGEVVDFALPESQGIIKKDGLVIFVPGVLPGERCRIRLRKIKHNYALGELVEVLEPSPFRQDHLCPHFREGCGGCRLQGIDYREQVRIKEKNALSTLERLGRVSLDTIFYEGFLLAPNPFEYRNKMEFNFGEKDGKLLLGLRPLNRYWDLVDLKICYLMERNLVARALEFFRHYGRDMNLTGYDPVRKNGVLRSLLLRLSREYKEVVVGLATTGDSLPGEQEMIRALRETLPEVQGFVHITNTSPASALLFEKKRILWGRDYFFEKIGHVTYRVSIESFFQVNSDFCLALYTKAREYADPSRDEVILDLYSGSGGIGLFLADSAKQVIGVEENPQAVEDAKFNAELNGVTNFTSFSGRVEKLLPLLPQQKVDVVVVDPPRAGLDRKVIQKIAWISPERLLYVSCNLGTFARDVVLLSEKGYTLRRIVFLDLFPQTPYFETVALFQK
ncbi:MAG: 23S rRNA (uracil(1939)-C(5))-methyltransferase RlmD [Atribacterota bacterium]|nr:23S rRNA (uracil(1939)-C(5))-methyltransferase RlmD [Atribacterota bacterium]